MSAINFFNEDVDYDISHSSKIKTWLNELIKVHEFDLISLNYIICSDNYLLEINKNYLNHDDFTDIITFDNSDVPGQIDSDIFISIDRVKENAILQNVSSQNELHRIICHGLLHLLGWNDKTDQEKSEMRKKEEACLSLLRI